MKNYQILKGLCRKAFISGSGNFWYEEKEIGNDQSLGYKIFCITLISVYILVTILEIMAATIGKFPDEEKSDSITFAVSHTIVMIKILSVINKKEFIKRLNKKMVKTCEAHEDFMSMKEKYKMVNMNVVAYFISVYLATVCYIYEGVRKLFEGIHFVTLVTYYPAFEDNSWPASVFRIFTTMVLFVMMYAMISIDSLAMAYLILYKYKYITIRNYFENLRKQFDEDSKLDLAMATDNLTLGVIDGIEMHKQVLSMTKDIDHAFGTVIAAQVCLSSGSAVSLLLQLALADNLSLVAGFKLICFVGALFLLLAQFLCNAGEITHEASLLTDSIFYCGWHLCSIQRKPGTNVRKMVILSCAVAQRPLVMKAFKLLKLSYGTYIQVVRTTYSVFALFLKIK